MNQRTIGIPDHEVEVQWGMPRGESYPNDSQLVDWVCKTLVLIDASPSCVSVRLMNAKEMSELNQKYRNKSTPTNVLSFLGDEQVQDQGEATRLLLGDIAVCTDVIESEALAQDKSLSAHLAHMLVHGVLHLCGYDHESDSDAKLMEQLEVEIMASFGFENPYDDADSDK